jgi:hypothetical protein
MVLVGENRCVVCSLVESMIFSSPFCEMASTVGISSFPKPIPILSLQHCEMRGGIA